MGIKNINLYNEFFGAKMLKWYVMQSKPNREFFLLSQLKWNHVETYLPLMKTRTSADNVRMKPFFPGYLFVHVDLSERGTSYLQWIPGSKGMVMFDGQPPSVPDNFIEALKHKLENLNNHQKPKLSSVIKGESVSIVRGVFEGYRAIFNEYLPECDRVRLLLKTLAENNFSIEIPAEDIAI